MELDESVVDSEFLAKKLDYSKRIATNRSQRLKLRQELSVYKKVEKTGEKPLEDPKVVSEVMKLKSDVDLEMELNSKLIKKLQDVENRTTQTKNQIREVADLIQQYKIEKAPQMMNESNRLHLMERKDYLTSALTIKEQKIAELKADLERLKRESETKSKQNDIIDKITEWQLGGTADASEPQHVQIAYQHYSTAGQDWREARFAYNQKKLIPDFYVNSWKALNHAVDCVFVLLAQETQEIKIQEKVDYLYRNKIIVNTKLLDSLGNLVDRINHGVDVTPTAQYPESVLEFMEKNMASLKIM